MPTTQSEDVSLRPTAEEAATRRVTHARRGVLRAHGFGQYHVVPDAGASFTFKHALHRLPGGKARDALYRAARQQAGLSWTPRGFHDDLESLVGYDPRVSYERGDRPGDVATVVVDLVDNRTVYLCTKDRDGLGLYVKLHHDETGRRRRPAIATDPGCGPARQQRYEVFD